MKTPYTWISDAARLLKMSKNSSDARLNPGWLADVDRLLAGVPIPNEDLGFNSPADRLARYETALQEIATSYPKTDEGDVLAFIARAALEKP